jgi:hypothetical protein
MKMGYCELKPSGVELRKIIECLTEPKEGKRKAQIEFINIYQ